MVGGGITGVEVTAGSDDISSPSSSCYENKRVLNPRQEAEVCKGSLMAGGKGSKQDVKNNNDYVTYAG